MCTRVVGYNDAVVYTTPNGVLLRLRGAERRAVCGLISQQRQAFNFGVAVCLEAVKKSGRVPSKFDCWKLLTEARRNGAMPVGVPVGLQRPGVALGRDAVKKWNEARVSHDAKVAYWEGASRGHIIDLSPLWDTGTARNPSAVPMRHTAGLRVGRQRRPQRCQHSEAQSMVRHRVGPTEPAVGRIVARRWPRGELRAARTHYSASITIIQECVRPARWSLTYITPNDCLTEANVTPNGRGISRNKDTTLTAVCATERETPSQLNLRHQEAIQ